MTLRRPAPAARSRGEETLALHIRADHLPPPRREFRFHPTRKWAFDFAWPPLSLAVEVEGLTREGGRHQRQAGYAGDLEKYNAAVLAGWRLLRFTPAQVQSGVALATIKQALTGGWDGSANMVD